MSQPPLCIDCDKEIPFERYRLGVCPECMEERAAMKHEEGCRCPECDPDWNDPRQIEQEERDRLDAEQRSEP